MGWRAMVVWLNGFALGVWLGFKCVDDIPVALGSGIVLGYLLESWVKKGEAAEPVPAPRRRKKKRQRRPPKRA
jgi:hypothetical protein